ncbi:MAG: hypothetical protein HC862_00985 [Scytonema sp. RU_4_4]|nr:hypothetical protein [Scytonema sp. RU_4_4]NJR76535.1 hypothetical protein [Scytonema sp. CRU_2_7]
MSPALDEGNPGAGDWLSRKGLGGFPSCAIAVDARKTASRRVPQRCKDEKFKQLWLQKDSTKHLHYGEFSFLVLTNLPLKAQNFKQQNTMSAR